MSNVINAFLTARTAFAAEQTKLDATRTAAVQEWEGLEYQLMDQPADWPHRSATVLRIRAIEAAHAAELRAFWEASQDASKEGSDYYNARWALRSAQLAVESAARRDADIARKAHTILNA